MKKIKTTFILRIGDLLESLFPNSRIEISKSGMDIDTKEYLGTLFLKVMLLFIFLSSIVVMGLFFLDIREKIPVFLIGIFLFSALIFILGIIKPKSIAQKKIKKVEQGLVSAIRDFKVQYNAGLSTYECMISISKGKYGEISNIFRDAIKQISTGKTQADVFKNMATKTPSPLFKRVLWQISNAIFSGGNISRVLEEITRYLSAEKINQITLFGSKMKPVSMMYMVVVVIVPAMGVTFLIILSNLMGFDTTGVMSILILIIVFVIFMQIVFFNLIKSRRPNLIED